MFSRFFQNPARIKKSLIEFGLITGQIIYHAKYLQRVDSQEKNQAAETQEKTFRPK